MQHGGRRSHVRRIARKAFYFSCFMFLFSFIISCISVKYVAIDQYVPAPYPLPKGTSIAVLNNFSPSNIVLIDEVYAYSFDGDSLMEYVAQALADTELFGEVVVLDSCIYPRGDTIIHLLTEQEVRQLCDTLAVDMLYVCDYGCVTSWGPDAIDGERKTYLASHVYLPGRKEPTHSFILDQFLRRGTYRNRSEVDRWIQRCYPIVGQMAAECFAPHWETRDRAFYDGSTYNMREATVCVREGDWEGASHFWQQLSMKKKPRQRLMSLFNLALCHEMNDSIGLALRCLDEADTYVTDTTAVDSVALRDWYDADFTIGDFPYTDHQRISQYRAILRERQDELVKILISEQNDSI